VTQPPAFPLPDQKPPLVFPGLSNRVPPRGSYYRCGELGHYANNCPQAKCNRCGRTGYTETRCPQSPTTRVNEIPVVRHVALFPRTPTNKKSSLRISATLQVGGREFEVAALLDSGAEVNLLHPRLLLPSDYRALSDHVAVSALFNRSTNALGSRDFLIKVQDSLSVVNELRTRFVVADIGNLDVVTSQEEQGSRSVGKDLKVYSTINRYN
jgi:hypothetical protein